jgi:hypothetical protein
MNVPSSPCLYISMLPSRYPDIHLKHPTTMPSRFPAAAFALELYYRQICAILLTRNKYNTTSHKPVLPTSMLEPRRFHNPD